MNKKDKIIQWFETKPYRIDDGLLVEKGITITKNNELVALQLFHSGQDWQIFISLDDLEKAEIYFDYVLLPNTEGDYFSVRFYREPEPIILEPLSEYLKIALIDGLSVANYQANGGYLMDEIERDQVAAWLENSNNPVAAANQQIDEWIAGGRITERPRVIYGGENIFHKLEDYNP